MNRVTNKMLDQALVRYTVALNSLEMGDKPDHTLQLHYGAKVNGNSYKLTWTNIYDGGWSSAPGTDPGGYLGMTKREALRTLQTICRTLEDVAFHKYEH